MSDSDDNPSKVRQILRKHLDLDKYWLIMAEPNVESWLTNGRHKGIDSLQQFVKLAGNADLGQIENAHPEFQTLKEAVTNIYLLQ